MARHKIKYPNHLYRLRRIRGISQMNLALILGHTSVRMVSRYETGVALPPTRTALLLQIALGAHLSDIYPEYFRALEQLAAERASKLIPHPGGHLRERIMERTMNDHTHT